MISVNTGFQICFGCAIAEGHVAVEGVDKPALGASKVDFDHGRRNAMLKTDGSFITSLEPGASDMDLSRITREHPFYVKSIRSGSQDILRSGFTAAPSERIDLDVLLGSDGGSVEGVVSDSDDKPVTGATVVLIPNDTVLRTRFDFTRDVVTDQAGHFELKSIAPGRYKLFAWDDIEPGSWFDPEVLRRVESKGEAVP
jgi:Carboxypeptidase regulatory-like domain